MINRKIFITIFCFLSLASMSQDAIILVNLKDTSIASKIKHGKAETSIQKLMKQFGVVKFEKAYPHAPSSSYRCNRYYFKIERKNINQFKKALENLSDVFEKVDTLKKTILTETFCTNPQPNDLSGSYSNQNLMNAINGQCA